MARRLGHGDIHHHGLGYLHDHKTLLPGEIGDGIAHARQFHAHQARRRRPGHGHFLHGAGARNTIGHGHIAAWE